MPQVTATTALTAKQANAVQLIALGWSRSRIATHLEIDPGTLSRWRRHPVFRLEVASLLEESESVMVDAFRATKLKAVERLTVLVDSPNQTVALRAIELILSRTNLSAQLPRGGSSDRPFDAILERYFKC